MYDENVPFEVNDFEVAPSDDQIGGDVIEAHSKVRFIVSKASIRQNEKKTLTNLNVQAKIGPMGVDGNGKYANKVIFADLLIGVDSSVYSSD